MIEKYKEQQQGIKTAVDRVPNTRGTSARVPTRVQWELRRGKKGDTGSYEVWPIVNLPKAEMLI